MEETKEKFQIGEEGFWPAWISKLLFTLISVKVWGLISSIAISTYLLLNQEIVKVGDNTFHLGINGAQWVTFNTTVWALIFGMKEVFRISEKRDKTEKEVLTQQLESKERVAAMIELPSGPSTVMINPDGTETVGSEPD